MMTNNFNVEFKAWDSAKKEWIPNNLLFMDYDGQVLAGDIYNPPYTLINPISVVFCSNLKDKNNKKIYYNSDIVKLKVFHKDMIKPCEYNGIINHDEFGNPKILNFYLVNLLDVYSYEFEILGNIYEDQELKDYNDNL